jgi:tetratricopeptide (TPR) repeat protein
MPRFGWRWTRPSVITRADQARDAGRWELAAGYYQEALRRKPENPPIWVQYGHVLKASGQLSQAKEAYRTALAYDREFSDAYVHLGHCLKLQGKMSDARAAYLRAFALNPSLDSAPAEFAELGWSDAHLSELQGMLARDITCEKVAPSDNGAAPERSVVSVAQEEPAGGSQSQALADAYHAGGLPTQAARGATASMRTTITTVPRTSRGSSDPTAALEGKEQASPPPNRLTISLLTFGSFEHCAKLLPILCKFLCETNEISPLKVTLVVRNNNPQLDAREFDLIWEQLRREYDQFNFMLFNDGVNVGYGVGHNLNFIAAECDYFLILNDDVTFPHLQWLPTALAILDYNATVGAVGAANNPRSITPYSNGAWDREWHHWPLRYIEGSIVLLRASVFAEAGKFDPAYEWALCEDADLSFRIQAIGYRLEWIEIPHEHRRASSFNTLPSQVKGAILEHNRSVLFSRWNTSIGMKYIGRYQIYDLWSDGIGDVFVSCLHLKSYLLSVTDAQRRTIIVNTSAPDVARLILGDDIVVETVADQHRLLASHAEPGVRNLNSLRGLNYALPFNIHTLLCGALGIPVAANDELANAINNRRRMPDTNSLQVLPEPYCVVHLEWERTNHDGRAPSPVTTNLIASLAAEIFTKIVLVGRSNRLAFDDIPASHVIDLRGKLSISALIDVIAHADTFVGLESFPAHIAQVMNVKSVVFFGSVHPLFRVLSTGQTWPIAKNINCIGCYHTLLEPAVPFCMRRDLACTMEIPEAEIRAVMERCAALEAFDWHVLEHRALELQQKFLLNMFYHPDSQRRFLNVVGTPQMATTGLIEAIIEQIRNYLVSGEAYGGTASLVRQIEDAHHEMNRKDVQIQAMVKLIGDLRAGR